MNEPTASISIDELIRHGAFVRALARRLVVDDSTADDVMQEVWLRALQRPPTHTGSITGWFKRVAHNLVRDRANAESARRDHESRRPVEVSSEENRSEIVEAIASAFAGLPVLYRDPLYLRYYEDKSPPEIAKALGCPLATVKTRLSRGIELLRQSLEQRTRERGRNLSSLLATLASVPEPAQAATASLSWFGGWLMAQKVMSAVLLLALAAAGWWVWRIQDVETVGGGRDNSPSSEVALVSDENAVISGEPETALLVPDTTSRTRAEGPFRVHVVDERGGALSGVAVTSVSDHEVEPLGSTDDKGDLELLPLPASTKRLVFSLATFAVQEIPPPQASQNEVEVVLRRGGAITGRAILMNSDPAVGIRVTTMPSSNRRPMRDWFDRLELGDPSVPCAVTDENGAFSIEGLAIGTTCVLRAGAPGFTQGRSGSMPAPVVPCDGVVVEIRRSFGVSFEFIDESSGELILTRELAGSVAIRIRNHYAQSAWFDDVESFLAGLHPDRVADKRRFTVFASSTDPSAENVPVVLDVQLVGYEKGKVDATAESLSREMPVVQVALTQTVAAFGTIGFRCIPAETTLPKTGQTLDSSFAVRLVAADGETLTLNSPSWKADVLKAIGRIPVGTYQVSVEANDGLFIYPPSDQPRSTILVEAGKQTLIEAPLDGAGSLLIERDAPEELIYASISLRGVEPRRGNLHLPMSGTSTLRIFPLNPGTYSIEIQRGSRSRQTIPATVTAGTETVVRVKTP